MLLHVLFWEFNTNGKNPDGKDHSRDFQGDCIANLNVSLGPTPGIEYVTSIRADDHAKKKGPNGFAYVELNNDNEGGLCNE